MIKYYRELLKLINRQMKKYWVPHNAKALIENGIGTVQNKFSSGRNNVEKYNVVCTKKFNNQASNIQYSNPKASELNVPLPEELQKWQMRFYRLVGLDTMEAAKREVDVLQKKLSDCQNRRIIVNAQMTNITDKLREVYGELFRTERDDPKYVHWITLENKCLQEQKKFNSQLALFEKEERDIFMQLTTAIKEYHDTQNLNARKYKYLSIITSVSIALISLLGSYIMHKRRTLDMRNTIDIFKTQEKNISLLDTNTRQLSDLQNMLMNSFKDKALQDIHTNKRIEADKENNNSSNILVTCAKYAVYPIISGASYTKRGVYWCASYIKSFYS